MKKNLKTIALLSDFGESDHYVATMKAVILSIAPQVRVVDISHSLQPQDVRAAAYVLWAAYRFFPRGTIFASIVDPGVGSERRILCVKTGWYTFLAPDNGLLEYVLSEELRPVIVAVQNKRLFLPEVSTTFHGRDIFAPVCAHLANGIPVSRLGPQVQLQVEKRSFVDAAIAGQSKGSACVIYIDRFGNLVTNIRVTGASKKVGHIELVLRRNILRWRTVIRYFPTYASAPHDTPFFTVGSSGLLEISVKNGSAAKRLGARIGTQIAISNEP